MVCTTDSNKTVCVKRKLSNKSHSWLSAKEVFVNSRYTHLCRVCLSSKERADWECTDCKLKFHQSCIPKNNDPNAINDNNNNNNGVCGWCIKYSYSTIECILTHAKNKHLVKWKSLSYLRCDWIPSGWFATRKSKMYQHYKENLPIVAPSAGLIIDSKTRILKILDIKKHNETLRITPNNVKMFRASYIGQKNRAYWEIPPSTTDKRYISYQDALDDFRVQNLVQSSKRTIILKI